MRLYAIKVSVRICHKFLARAFCMGCMHAHKLTHILVCSHAYKLTHIAIYISMYREPWIKQVFEYSKLEAKSRATIREIFSESKAIKEGLSKEGNFDSRHNYINMQFCLLLPFSPYRIMIDHDSVYVLHLLSSLLSSYGCVRAVHCCIEVCIIWGYHCIYNFCLCPTVPLVNSNVMYNVHVLSHPLTHHAHHQHLHSHHYYSLAGFCQLRQ